MLRPAERDEDGACAESCDEPADQADETFSCLAIAGPSTRIGSSATVTAATISSRIRMRPFLAGDPEAVPDPRSPLGFGRRAHASPPEDHCRRR